MKQRRRLTLGQVFALALFGLASALTVLFWMVYSGSREALLRSAEQLHRAKSDEIAARVEAGLSATEDAVLEVEKQLRYGATRCDDFDALEQSLFGAILHRAELVELTFTSASGQLALLRIVAGGVEHYVTRRLRQVDGAWIVSTHDRALADDPGAAPIEAPDTPGMDPTEHPTYTTPQRFPNRALWSDLSFAELDAMLPPPERRKVLTVQKAIYGPTGDFIGVLRAGLRAQTIDTISGKDSFICDHNERLVTRVTPDDTYATLDADGAPDEDGDVRVVTHALPASLAAALVASAAGSGDELVQQSIRAGGQNYLLTLRPLPRTQDWVVGVMAPESDYLGPLTGARNELLAGAATLMLALLGGALLLLRSVRRDLGRVVAETERMRRFEFTPASSRSAFRDVDAALESLERAKTALRALGKYAPIALVRQLYDSRREPTLGGDLQDVTISFSDIEGFTTLAETMTPDALAQDLGRYLETMTEIIQDNGGTIDKYVGDAVMTLWNTPRRVDRHALAACRAALRCIEETRSMFPTRIGIHRDTVMVGHFGSPTRLSFTAIGDGVNLASRLEGLGKYYGTQIIVSEAVAADAAGEMVLRRLDRVAVKGKRRACDVFELCGRLGEVSPLRMVRLARYQSALSLYFSGRFAEALALFEVNPDDPPSRVLADRCRRLIALPPEGWTGVYEARDK